MCPGISRRGCGDCLVHWSIHRSVRLLVSCSAFAKQKGKNETIKYRYSVCKSMTLLYDFSSHSQENQLLIGSLDIDTSSHLYERMWDLSFRLWVCCAFLKRTKYTAQAKHRMSPDSSFHHRQLFPQIKWTPLRPSKPSPSQALPRLFNSVQNCLKKLQKHICYLV